MIVAYALPAWFTLRLLRDRIGVLESVLLHSLIPLSLLLSIIGMIGSLNDLMKDIQGGEGGGWS